MSTTAFECCCASECYLCRLTNGPRVLSRVSSRVCVCAGALPDREAEVAGLRSFAALVLSGFDQAFGLTPRRPYTLGGRNPEQLRPPRSSLECIKGQIEAAFTM